MDLKGLKYYKLKLGPIVIINHKNIDKISLNVQFNMKENDG